MISTTIEGKIIQQKYTDRNRLELNENLQNLFLTWNLLLKK